MSTDEGVHAEVAGRAPAPGRRRASRRSVRRPRPVRSRPASATPVTSRRSVPRFLDRSHPVFTPLSGFFTGLVTVVVVVGLLGAILDLVGYDLGDHSWAFLAALGVLLAVNLGLVVKEGTRRFARYMLLGILLTPTVVAVVAWLTFSILLKSDT